jgi:heat shock protein HslJ/uncharacterized protein YecT (DUF1311 family)
MNLAGGNSVMGKACLGVLLAVVCGAGALPADAGPREECAATGATLPCLDAKLKEANKKLNTTLKAAQERLEQIQARGGRPMMGAFVDSQRKFNAYRDAQCSWQGVRAAPSENTAEYVRECQLTETLVREEQLAAFASGGGQEAAAAAAPAEEPAPPVPAVADVASVQPPAPAQIPAPVAVDPVPPQAATPPPSAGSTASRGVEWRLLTWVVGGQQKTLLQDSAISIAFDPSGKIAGNASINRFTGTYSFDADGRLKWPPAGFAMTRMAGPPALMAQERAFLESLRRTSRYKVEDQQLVLESANSSVVLAFTR